MRLAIACALAGCVDVPPPPPCGTFPIGGVNTVADEQGPWLSPDRLELFFTRQTAAHGYQIIRATRNDAGEDFGQLAELNQNINTDDDEGDAFVTDDRLELYFSRKAPAGDPMLYYAQRSAPDSADFGSAMQIFPGEHPSISADGLDLFFSTSVGISVAHRASTMDNFSTVADTGLSSSRAPSISADGQTLALVATFADDPAFTHIGTAKRIGQSDFDTPEIDGDTDPETGFYDLDPQIHRPGFDYPDAAIVFASTRPHEGRTGTDYDLFIGCE